MKTTSASTLDPRRRWHAGLALTLIAAAVLQSATLWLVLERGPRLATGALVAVAGGALGWLLAGLLLTLVIGRGRAAAPAAGAPSAEEAAALAHSQKMQALGLLAGGVAHDFNNQLHVIRNSLEVLQQVLQRQGAAADTRRYLELIRRSADRAAALTGRLLAYSRRQSPEPRPLDLNDLVTQVVALLRPALGERITVETALGAGIAPIAADAGQLETALLNLAINARDAIPQAGRLTIETANAALDGSLRPYVMIAVSDTGAGMPADVAARACEPFFTTKEAGRGTGLGLSQVAGFAQQSGGQLRIASAPGQGTTVRLYLPRAGRTPERPQRRLQAPRWHAGSMKDTARSVALAVGAGAER